MAPGLCTVERFDLLMVVKMSDLNLSTSERLLFIKPILAKRTPELWKVSHLPEATQYVARVRFEPRVCTKQESNLQSNLNIALLIGSERPIPRGM